MYFKSSFNFSPPGNLARNGIASQSTTAHGGKASNAIDGDRNGYWKGRSCTHTSIQDNPQWSVDLKATYPVEKVGNV